MKKAVDIKCADGYKLSAMLFEPDHLKAAVMIAPATGIKKTFYYSFASFLAENGYGVICFDNRGIGASGDGSISKSEASLVSWGKLDMTAALETLKSNFPNTDYHLIGHSAGGQLVGLMDNAMDLKSVFNIACSSGCLRNMEYPFRLKAVFFMNYFIPFSNLLFGHTKSHWVNMGEPLPKKVAAQWSEWCNGEGYVKVELDKAVLKHNYDTLMFPSQWLYATDDDIANYKNVKDMIRVFPRIDAEIIPLKPADLGYKHIGHMGFFSSKKKDLWRYAVDWLEGSV